jgi:hypothetical protein
MAFFDRAHVATWTQPLCKAAVREKTKDFVSSGEWLSGFVIERELITRHQYWAGEM